MPQPLLRSPYSPGPADRPSPALIGELFIELQSVDSTNNYARRLINEGLAQHGTAIFAHEQLSGRGQRGKVWNAEKDANILMSILVKPEPLVLSKQFQLSAAVSLATYEFFVKYTGDLNTRIKWPNDLYWQDRKAGGLLIENVVSSHQSSVGSQQSPVSNWQWAIIGIGININQISFPSELQNPVSLHQVSGKKHDTILLAKEFCSVFNKYFLQLITEGFDSIYSKYLDHLYKKNEKVKLKKGNRVFEVTIKSISPTGKLIAQHAIEEEFDFGEVEWVI